MIYLLNLPVAVGCLKLLVLFGVLGKLLVSSDPCPSDSSPASDRPASSPSVITAL